MKKNNKLIVAGSSVFASILLTGMKLVVGLLTGSIGILSEAAHSALDFGAALITFFAVKYSDKPADKTHPYGHGKIESISALAETVLLVITSIWIIYEAVHRLLVKSVEIEVTWYAFAVMIISIVVDVSRSRALFKAAKENKSQALEADALHFQSDILSSGVVIVGLFFVSLGIKGADAIAAIAVALIVVFISYRLGRRTFDVLIDTAPRGLTEQVQQVILEVEGVLSVERLRLRPTGHTYFVDMIIGVSRKLPLETIHRITDEVEKTVQKSISDADVVIHTKPIVPKDETIVDRIQLLAQRHNLSVHDISVQSLETKKYVNFDLEVPSDLSIEKAHKAATHLEHTIEQELGEDVVIESHLEPLRPSVLKSAPVSVHELDRVKNAAIAVQKQLGHVRDIHQIEARTVSGKLFVTLHGFVPSSMPLEEAHALSSKLEYLMKEKLPSIERVVVHIEPEATLNEDGHV
ncbi:cation-efflux pump [Candidatus Roizmanbacteria bacterium]|nr:cation-efflux pump [Candidatus Roizmanbacteria bacterium]